MYVLRYAFLLSVFLLLYLGIKDYYEIYAQKHNVSEIKPTEQFLSSDTVSDTFLPIELDQSSEKTLMPPPSDNGISKEHHIDASIANEISVDHIQSQYRVLCEKTASKVTSVQQKEGVYRWRDAAGKWHFGDRDALRTNNVKNSDDVSEKYLSVFNVVEVNILSDGEPLITSTEESIHSDVKQIVKILSHFIDEPRTQNVELNLRFVKSAEKFNDYLRESASYLKTSRAFYDSLNHEVVIQLDQDSSLLFELIRHESAHVIMASLLGDIPTWLSEGFSEYFERMALDQHRTKLLINDYWLAVIKAKPISLEQYLAIEELVWRQKDQHQMYAYAWGLVYFLMGHDDGQRLLSGMLNQMAEQPCERIDSSDFIRRYYPMGFKGLNKKWQAWLGSNINHHDY